MFCPKGSIENEKSSQFCSSCGFQVEEDSVDTLQPAPIVYAGFWRRFVAFLIDEIILTIGGAIIIGKIIQLVGNSEADIGTILVMGIVVLPWLYFTLLESSSKQATLGKMVMRIIVTDLDANQISFSRATGRYWSKIISWIILYIGFIMAGFTRKKQALHDIIARTLVVKK